MLIKVITDPKSLEYFMFTKKMLRHQVYHDSSILPYIGSIS